MSSIPQNLNQQLQTAVRVHQQGNSRPLWGFIQHIVSLPSTNAESLVQLGDALLQGGMPEFALACYRHGLLRDPAHFRAWVHGGLLLSSLGQNAEAVAYCDRAIRLQSKVAMIYSNQSAALKSLGRLAEARASSQKAIILDCQFQDAYYNLALAYEEGDAPILAGPMYRRTYQLSPLHARARNNHGKLMQDADDAEAALKAFRFALAIEPRLSEGLSNIGGAFSESRRFDHAVRFYTRAIAVQPGLVSAHMGRAMTHLLVGDYAAGLEDYEWRLRDLRQHHGFRPEPPPHYRGEPLKGKTLHVYWEQGLGDTLQFCRFAALLAEQGVQVILNVQPPLVALLSSLLPDVEVISEAPFLRYADYQVPLLSLPHFLGVRVETLPKIPHLDSVASDLKIHGRHRVASVGGTPKIGLVWSGSRAHKNDRNRSLPFEVIRPILDLPFSFHCLQQEIREEERGTVEAAQSLTCYERLLLDFTDTAALILEMDLVISVDTSVAHLAGVLGKPVWILLPYTPDFRWLLERADSPWYPSARLYRQDLRREWPSVIQTVVEDLKKKDF